MLKPILNPIMHPILDLAILVVLLIFSGMVLGYGAPCQVAGEFLRLAPDMILGRFCVTGIIILDTVLIFLQGFIPT